MDIQYAFHLLKLKKHGELEVAFAHQVRNQLFLVDGNYAEWVILACWNRWIRNVDDESLSIVPLVWQTKTHFNFSSLLKPKKAWIDPNLLELMKTYSERVYINSHHIGAQFDLLHQTLKTHHDCRLVFYVHDLIPIYFPEYNSTRQVTTNHFHRIKGIAQFSDLVLCNSQDTRSYLKRFCAEQNLQIPPVEIIYLGTEEIFLSPPTPDPDALPVELRSTPFFVILSTIEPRKNHITLLHLWREWIEREGDERVPKLVIMGKRGWRNQQITDLLDFSPRLKGHVFEYNHLSDKEMIPLLQHACALLFPSFAEGWGIPAAEALTLKTPVICSDLDVFKECTQNLATMLSPIDGLGWKHAISTHIPRRPTVGYQPNLWSTHLSQLDQAIDRVFQKGSPACLRQPLGKT